MKTLLLLLLLSLPCAGATFFPPYLSTSGTNVYTGSNNYVGPVTFSGPVATATNLSTQNPNCWMRVSLFVTNGGSASFQFLPLTNVDTAGKTYQEFKIFVTNGTPATVKQIIAPANVHTNIAQGNAAGFTGNVTNLTLCTFEVYPTFFTNLWFRDIF